MAPILDGLGLILVVLSYHGRVSIGISSCEQIMPDPDNMAECIERSLDELEHEISQAGSVLKTAGQPMAEVASRETSDALKEFRDASKALDKAIDSLGD